MEQCSTCGAAVQADDRTCLRCGAALAASAGAVTHADRPPPEPVFRVPTRTLAFIIIGCVIITTAVFVVLLSR